MTTKLFISIPQQRHGEREGDREREREREREDGMERGERGRNWKRYGMDTRGEKACGQNCSQDKKKKGKHSATR